MSANGTGLRLVPENHTESTVVTVFAVIARRISDWPGIPFAVVSVVPDHRKLFASYAVDRFVAVHDDVSTAERARHHPPQRRAVQALVAANAASLLARLLVRRVCGGWGVPAYVADVELIATELVENTLRHTISCPRLTLELRRAP